MSNSLEQLQKISPDLEDIYIAREPVGHDGWLVHLCYNTGKCADFGVDRAEADVHDMDRLTDEAIIKQLEYHESIKEKS